MTIRAAVAGVARALIETVLDEARTRGIDDFEMSSWTFNASAHDAFRRLGFAPKVVRFELTRKPP